MTPNTGQSDALIFRVIVDPPQNGAWNMAVDEALMKSVGSDSSTNSHSVVLRFYQWDEPTLSLGYFQAHADRQQHHASRDIPLVRRNSGGGAIVHDQELTYSLTIGEGIAKAVFEKSSDLYGLLHSTLIDVLMEFGVRANLVTAPDKKLEKEFLCFKRRAPNDVIFDKHKICGSAQRKKYRAISQHGSIILGTSTCAPEIIGINDIVDGQLTAAELCDRWIPRIVGRLGWQQEVSELSETERLESQKIREGKFSAFDWNLRR